MELLASIAAQAGLPVLTAILMDKLGAANGRLAADVIARIAARLGVSVDQVGDTATNDRPAVEAAMREVERSSPELLPLYLQEAQAAQQIAAQEATEPLWMRAWRPGGMYLIGFLWVWDVVILHVANAIWKTALPPVPFGDLLQLSALYFGLYMGGHTVKDVMAKWRSK